DRVWRNVAKSYRVDPSTPGAADEAMRPATAWLQHLVARASEGRQPDDDGRHRLLLVNNLPLTAAEAEQFGEELVAFQERWVEQTFESARSDPSTPREIYQLLMALGPRHEEADDADRQVDLRCRPAGVGHRAPGRLRGLGGRRPRH